ncbi:MAG: cytochrome c [Variibacter sp.]
MSLLRLASHSAIARHVVARHVVASLMAASLGPANLVAPAAAQNFDEKFSVCLACHGADGRSETADIPNLAAQRSQYVVIQLYMFRQGLRKAVPMNDVAKDLGDAELQRFADAIAKLPAVPAATNADPARMQRGAALVNQHRCNFCHNRDFTGNESVPRLAGQREDYLLKSLREYKAGTRTEYQPVMAEVVPPLKDADLAELAYYIAHFKP